MVPWPDTQLTGTRPSSAMCAQQQASPKSAQAATCLRLMLVCKRKLYHHSSPILIVPLANTNKSCTWRRAVQKRAARKTQLLDK